MNLKKKCITALTCLSVSLINAAPLKISQSGGTIYGYLGYYESSTNSTDENGWYEVMTDGDYKKQWAPAEGPLTTGFIRNNELCTYVQQTVMGLLVRAFYSTFDLNTGECTSTTSLSTYMKPLMVVCTAYDPEEDAAYGYSYPVYGDGHVFVKINMQTPTVMPKIVRNMQSADDEVCYSMTYSPADKQIYGINKRGEMVRINKTDGTEEIIYKPDTGQDIQNLVTGLVYSPFDQGFIWNTYLADGNSYLFKLDPQKKTCEQLAKFERKEEFNFFVTTDDLIDFDGPAAPTIISNTFIGSPATTGSFKVKMPEKMYDGTSISGDIQLRLSARIDGKEKTSVEGLAGSEVNVSFEDIETGMHNFEFVVYKGENFSIPDSEKLFIGNDTPAKPANLIFTSENISWDAVTEGSHGGYIDRSAVTYEVVVDEESVATTSGTEYTHTLPSGTVSAHYAKVTAVCNGARSETAVSDKLLHGDPLELDVVFGPKDDDEFELFTVIDSNGDDTSWHTIYDDYEFDDTSFFEYRYNKTEKADDWLILPPLNLSDAESYYNLAFDAAASPVLLRDGKYPVERFEVYIGTAPTAEAMTHQLMGPTEPDPEKMEYTRYVRNFSVDAPGTYYIGIHAISDPFQFKLRIKDINVTRLASADIPEQVSELKGKAGANGGLTAVVSFKMPEATASGVSYDDNVRLSAEIKTKVETKKLENLAPGAVVETEIATANGSNEISVQVICNGFMSKVSRIDVYAGLDIPAFVNDFSATEDEQNKSITITWKAPTEGMHEGGYISPEGLTYYLVTVGSNLQLVYTMLGKDVYEYTYTPETSDDKLTETYFSIIAENEAGRLPENRIPMAMCVMGKPYTLPIADDFSHGNFAYSPITTWAVDESYLPTFWQVMDPSEISSEYSSQEGLSIVGRTSSAGSRGRFSLPKFSTEGVDKPVLSFDTWIGMSTAPFKVYAETFGTGLVEVGSIIMSLTESGWTPCTFELPAQFVGKPWVCVYFDAEFPSLQKYVMIDNYSVYDKKQDSVNDILPRTSGSIVGVDGGILISGLDGSDLTIMTIDGRLLMKGHVSGNEDRISLAAGFYIVQAGNNKAKIFIK